MRSGREAREAGEMCCILKKSSRKKVIALKRNDEHLRLNIGCDCVRTFLRLSQNFYMEQL